MSAARRKDDFLRKQAARWPLQIGEYPYGWTITVFGPDGHVRHLASAENDVQAFRTARKLARVYHISGDVLIRTAKGTYYYPVSRLLS